MTSDKLLFLAVIAVAFAPMAWWLLTPIPRGDVEAIGAFLAVIDQKPERISRLLFGGPWDCRPYRVLAREADYGLRTHVLAIDGVDANGQPRVRERVGKVWSRSLRKWG